MLSSACCQLGSLTRALASSPVSPWEAPDILGFYFPASCCTSLSTESWGEWFAACGLWLPPTCSQGQQCTV